MRNVRSPQVGLRSAAVRERIWEIVEHIPSGRVVTYGDIAAAAGITKGARLVGWAMRNCPPHQGLPWHRVLSAGGRIALAGARGQEQRLLLLNENVPFSGNRVCIEECRWEII